MAAGGFIVRDKKPAHNIDMADPRFHVPDLNGAEVQLAKAEARHASQSRRLRPGDAVILFDGQGTEAGGEIAAVSRSGVHVRILKTWARPRLRPAVTLAVAMPKGPRQDVLVEKCTELGIAGLWPIQTDRSVSEVSDHRLDKWRRTAIEAAKQSGQAWLPVLSPLRRLSEALAESTGFDRLFIAVPNTQSPSRWVPDVSEVESVLGLIGPEGGWTESELAVCADRGCRAISLGPNTLRIETAAIAFAALLHASFGRA